MLTMQLLRHRPHARMYAVYSCAPTRGATGGASTATSASREAPTSAASSHTSSASQLTSSPPTDPLHAPPSAAGTDQ